MSNTIRQASRDYVGACRYLTLISGITGWVHRRSRAGNLCGERGRWGDGGVDGRERRWSIIMGLEIVPVVLDELVLTVVVDNATDNLSSVDSGIPQLPEVVSLLGRIPATRHHEGHDAIVVFDQLCVACHGLSVLVQGRR